MLERTSIANPFWKLSMFIAELNWVEWNWKRIEWNFLKRSYTSHTRPCYRWETEFYVPSISGILRATYSSAHFFLAPLIHCRESRFLRLSLQHPRLCLSNDSTRPCLVIRHWLATMWLLTCALSRWWYPQGSCTSSVSFGSTSKGSLFYIGLCWLQFFDMCRTARRSPTLSTTSGSASWLSSGLCFRTFPSFSPDTTHDLLES